MLAAREQRGETQQRFVTEKPREIDAGMFHIIRKRIGEILQPGIVKLEDQELRGAFPFTWKFEDTGLSRE